MSGRKPRPLTRGALATALAFNLRPDNSAARLLDAKKRLDAAVGIIRDFLDAPRSTYEGIEHPDQLVARAARWMEENAK